MSSDVGLATEFHSEKILWNRLGMVSFIPQKKVLIPRHSKFYGRVNSKARKEGNRMKKITFTKTHAPENTMFSSETASERNSERLFLFLFYGTEFQVVLSSAEWFRRELRELLLFLFHGTEFPAFFRKEFREFSVPRNSQNPAGTNQLFHLFRLRQNNFFVRNCQPYYVAPDSPNVNP
jgi:hypothetical protein